MIDQIQAISWEGTPSGYFREVGRWLPAHINLVLEKKPNKVLDRVQGECYSFALLDMFDTDQGGSRVRAVGLALSDDLAVHQPSLPVIIATDYMRPLDDETWSPIGKHVQLWSRTMPASWFADRLVKFVDEQNLAYENNSIAILGNSKHALMSHLTSVFEDLNLKVSFVELSTPDDISAWERSLAEIRKARRIIVCDPTNAPSDAVVAYFRLRAMPGLGKRVLFLGDLKAVQRQFGTRLEKAWSYDDVNSDRLVNFVMDSNRQRNDSAVVAALGGRPMTMPRKRIKRRD